MKTIKTNIINPVSETKIDYIPNCFIKIENNKIKAIERNLSQQKIDYDYSEFICLPGLIDTHIHLSQYYCKGKHAPDLLQWLNQYIFPTENKSKDAKFAKNISEDFFKALLKAGTTTSIVYTAPFKNACNIAFQTAEMMGIRAIIGKTMMDTNSPDFLTENSEKSLTESIDLYETWNAKTELLDYIFTPRFAPVCSPGLMKDIGKFIKDNKAYMQTHLSENLNEIKWVESLFPQSESYTHVYDKFDLITEKSIFGHCIHLKEKEMDLLRNKKAKIAHCPDSNFFLKSGRFPWKKMSEKGIDFALATDVGAGTSVSMFHTMKMAIYMQNKADITPTSVFYRSTLGAAKTIAKNDKIGSIEKDKMADLIFLSLPEFKKKSGKEILSELVYKGSENEIYSTFIAGKQLYKSGF